MDSYNQKKRALCPRCNGTKVKETWVDELDFKGWKSEMCPTCLGEGICDLTIVYTPINAKP